MHTAKKQYEMDMCSGSILKKMLLFTLPLMLSRIFFRENNYTLLF